MSNEEVQMNEMLSNVECHDAALYTRSAVSRIHSSSSAPSQRALSASANTKAH